MSTSIVSIENAAGASVGFGLLNNSSDILYPRVYPEVAEAWYDRWGGPHQRSAWDIQCPHAKESVVIRDGSHVWSGTMCAACEVLDEGIDPFGQADAQY